MPQGLYNWSRTAATNASADSSINWSEGQPPSSVNDSARAMMARIAEWRDDMAGNGVTSGTSSAYTFTSKQSFLNTTLMTGAEITILPHATNVAGATLNVDGLGAFPIRTVAGTSVGDGVLVALGVYTLSFNTTEWILHGFFGEPHAVPIGTVLDFTGSSAPNSGFVFPFGQQISQSTYAALYALYGSNRYGADGGGLFYLPDLRGRVTYGRHDMGGADASPARMTTAAFGSSPATLGNVGGAESVTLSSNQIPSLTSVNASQSITVGPGTKNLAATVGGNVAATSFGAGGAGVGPYSDATNWGNELNQWTRTNSISVSYTNGSQQITKTLPPGMIVNKLLRII